MNNCLREFLFKCVLVFVDDIVVWSPDLDSHEQDLANVFSKLMEHGFQLPHHSIAAINLHISDKKYIRELLILISATVLKHLLTKTMKLYAMKK